MRDPMSAPPGRLDREEGLRLLRRMLRVRRLEE